MAKKKDLIDQLDQIYATAEQMKLQLSTMPTVYGYVRVSSKGQAEGNSLEAQIKSVTDAGAEKVFQDIYTGTTISRPEFTKLLNEICGGDTLIVTKLDRIARTVREGVALIEDLVARGVIVHVLNMGAPLDNTPENKLRMQMMMAFAEFERNMILTRTSEGRAIARQRLGYKEGRPNKYTQQQLSHAMDLLLSNSYTQVSKMTGISKSTLIREHKKILLQE